MGRGLVEIRTKHRASLLLKVTVLLLGFLGQAASMMRHQFMSGNHFLYYTNQTNALIILLMAVLIGYEWKARGTVQPALLPGWLAHVRFVLTSAILLTFAGFSLLLIPLVDRDYLLSPSNLLVHNAVPLLAGLDYVLFSRRDERPRTWTALVGPAAYVLFTLILAQTGHRFHGSVAPYYFLDYETLGWLKAGEGRIGVIWWLMILGAVQLAIGKILTGLRKLASNKV